MLKNVKVVFLFFFSIRRRSECLLLGSRIFFLSPPPRYFFFYFVRRKFCGFTDFTPGILALKRPCTVHKWAKSGPMIGSGQKIASGKRQSRIQSYFRVSRWTRVADPLAAKRWTYQRFSLMCATNRLSSQQGHEKGPYFYRVSIRTSKIRP